MAKTNIGATRESVLNFALKKYGTTPDYPWWDLPDYAVLRRPNKKWYALIMNISRDKLGLQGKEKIDILNVRADIFERSFLLSIDGVYPAYHMHKGNWLTIALDGSVDEKIVFSCLEMSYQSFGRKKNKAVRSEPIPWLIPANPKYYDVEKAFANSKEIRWKQARGVVEGDEVFLYMASPVSAVKYQCLVKKTHIPFEYKDENLQMDFVMNIELVKTFPNEDRKSVV